MHPSPPTATRAARRGLALISAVLLSATALAQISPAHAAAAPATIDGLTYVATPGNPTAGATVTSCGTAGPTISVPDTVTIEGVDYAVTAIGDYACDNLQLTSVTLPSTLASIGYAAFTQNQLASVSLPDTLTTLGQHAFSWNQLTSATLPDALTSISDHAFAVNQLTSVDLPDQLTTIGARAFASNRLTSLTLPGSVTAVGDSAFYSNQLASASLGEGLVSIGPSAFAGNQLVSVTLSDSLTSIGDMAFAWNRLTTIVFPDALTDIGPWSFYGNQLTSLALPTDLTTIGDTAFGSNRLTSVTLPRKVTSIGAGAFESNFELTQIRFTGPAPAAITGPDQERPSLGTAAGLTVAFHARYQGQTPQQGFTTPEWLGYTALPAYTMTFDTGASGSIVEPEIVWPGLPLNLPADPVRPSHVFTGWFTQLYPKRPFDPQAPLTSDLTLRAGWKYSQDSTRPPLVSSTSLNLGSLGALEAAPGN